MRRWIVLWLTAVTPLWAGNEHWPRAVVEESLRNPWPEAWEREFEEAARHTVKYHAGRGYGNTFFENEKSSYPAAMLDFLAGNRERALAFLQEEDNQAGTWNKITLGIDYFPSFTLKGQMRKYFLFGPFLKPEYRQRMYDAAKIWTEQDPLRRPHPAFKGGGDGWTPEVKNSWVDVRNTDNLRMMRDTSIYLMAEETGNEATRRVALERLRYEVWAMYNIGMGEWDSENYLGHSFTPWLNLYDFAKDRNVKLMAKAALDWMSMAAAVKYWRGGANGPTKRDYYHPRVWDVPLANEFGIYFQDAPIPPPQPSRDHVHAITSAYRPPAAVVELARKNFSKPVELWLSHPTYDHKAQPEKRPEFFETQYIADTFMLGSLPTGNSGDVNGLKMLVWNSKRGVDFFIPATGKSPTKITTSSSGQDAVAQYRNVVILLSADGATPVHWFGPKRTQVRTEDGVTVFEFEKTWAAIYPIELSAIEPNAEATRTINEKQNMPDEQIWTAAGKGGKYCGFVMEVGSGKRQPGRLDLSGLAEGVVSFTTAGGQGLKLRHNGAGLPTIWRDGQEHDWKLHWPMYQNADGSDAPVRQGWQAGKFRVEAGGRVFEGAWSGESGYTFRQR